MTFAFQYHHGAMLLRYAGISFISGAVNHGFFSGERSLWTAAIGMLLFVLGAAMEHRLTDSEAETAQAGLVRTLVLGALLSIGLGFFTGGLQHFPDSPARSAWVVPLGFFISVLALALSTTHPWQGSTTGYVLVAGLLIGFGSYGAWQWLQAHPQWAATGHAHGDAPTHAHDDVAGVSAGPSLVITRSVEVRMDDQMRFFPATLSVQSGETIRFVVHNSGQVDHEMVLGSDADIQAHALAMRSVEGQDHSHAHAGDVAAITVPAGQKGELVVRFDTPGTLQMACLIPGHYEAGMRGQVTIAPAPVPTSTSPAAHDHSTHQH